MSNPGDGCGIGRSRVVDPGVGDFSHCSVILRHDRNPPICDGRGVTTTALGSLASGPNRSAGRRPVGPVGEVVAALGVLDPEPVGVAQEPVDGRAAATIRSTLSARKLSSRAGAKIRTCRGARAPISSWKSNGIVAEPAPVGGQPGHVAGLGPALPGPPDPRRPRRSSRGTSRARSSRRRP